MHAYFNTNKRDMRLNPLPKSLKFEMKPYFKTTSSHMKNIGYLAPPQDDATLTFILIRNAG